MDAGFKEAKPQTDSEHHIYSDPLHFPLPKPEREQQDRSGQKQPSAVALAGIEQANHEDRANVIDNG